MLSIIICFFTFKREIIVNETKNDALLQTINKCSFPFLCQKNTSLLNTNQWLIQMRQICQLVYKHSSFCHPFLVYIFQVTKEITNSLSYINILNKLSLNKTIKEALLRAECSYCLFIWEKTFTYMPFLNKSLTSQATYLCRGKFVAHGVLSDL